jgi:Mor family transcriptional regulator
MARTRDRGKVPLRLAERNVSILADYVSGRKSVAVLAREWKVVESRIRQIIKAEGKRRA